MPYEPVRKYINGPYRHHGGKGWVLTTRIQDDELGCFFKTKAEAMAAIRRWIAKHGVTHGRWGDRV